MKQVFDKADEKSKKKFQLKALNNSDYNELFKFFLQELPVLLVKFLKIDVEKPSYKHIAKKQ